MNFFKTLEQINRLHYLIKEEKTGNPDTLSKRLGIARATLYRIIDELKSYDAPIDYSRSKESFYYTKEFHLDMKCSIQIIDDEIELRKIVGGYNFFSSVSFLRRKDDNSILIK